MTKSVLLIEDEPNITEAVHYILSRDGWTVKTHAKGDNANDVISSYQPDLIILDVMLPGKNGYDILRDLRQSAEGVGTPVLMLTARGQNKDREKAKALGCSRFMTKPFSNQDLIAAVRELAGL